MLPNKLTPAQKQAAELTPAQLEAVGKGDAIAGRQQDPIYRGELDYQIGYRKECAIPVERQVSLSYRGISLE